MEKGRILLSVLVVAASAFGVCGALEIASFNVQVFGQTKLSNAEVVDVLNQVVHRYDIILIQEIRDITEETIYTFTDIVNEGSSVTYGVVASERLGRTNSKEQYGFLYRTSVVEVVETYQHDDTDDTFEREPFSVLFRTIAGSDEFFLMGIHVKPSDVAQEIEALAAAFQQASDFHGTTRGAIMGDMNAGCSYLSRSRYEELELVNNPSFYWLLGYDADTTVAISPCPYDRFIVHESLNGSVIVGSASVFNYTAAYSLTAEQATAVSDHYPIQFQLAAAVAQATPTVAQATPTVTQATRTVAQATSAVTPSSSPTLTPTLSTALPSHTPTTSLLLTATGLVAMATMNCWLS